LEFLQTGIKLACLQDFSKGSASYLNYHVWV
jgi:hypothetical protein